MRISGNKQHYEPFTSRIPPFRIFLFSLYFLPRLNRLTRGFGVHSFANLKIRDYRIGEKDGFGNGQNLFAVEQ